MNQVDVSAEKVESEWEKIAIDFKVPIDDVPDGSVEELSGEVVEDEVVLTPEEFADKKAVTQKLLSSGLSMAFFMLKVEDIPDSIVEDFTGAWAEVIVNRFPENPVTDFMDAYGDLISAGGATLVLIGAVRTSKGKVQSQIKESMQVAREGVENGQS